MILDEALSVNLIKTVEGAVDAYGLQSLKGSDGEVNVHEDVAALAKAYKPGDSITFTATLNAAYDPEKEQQSTVAGGDDEETVADEES